MADPKSPEERLKRRKKAAKAALAKAQGYPVDSLTEAEKGYLKALQEPIDVMPPFVDPKTTEAEKAKKAYLHRIIEQIKIERDKT